MEKQVTRDKSQAGFSLIELLVVVAIIGVLAAAGIVGYTSYLNGVKDDTQKNNAKSIAQALETEITVKSGSLAGGICSSSGTNAAADAALALPAVSSNLTCVQRIIKNGKFKDAYASANELVAGAACAAGVTIAVTPTDIQACKANAPLAGATAITINSPAAFAW